MRINPVHLKTMRKTGQRENRMICIRVYDKKKKEETLSIKFPFALASLTLQALPDKEKKY